MPTSGGRHTRNDTCGSCPAPLATIIFVDAGTPQALTMAAAVPIAVVVPATIVLTPVLRLLR